MDKKEEYKRAMERALTPRTADGKIVPMVSCKGSPEELYYPCVVLDENGCIDPMFDLADFADGKIPANLQYVPGHQREFVSVDAPGYMDSIVYRNPEYNLPPAQQYLLREARKSNIPPMKIKICGGDQTAQPDRTDAGKKAAEPKNSDELVIDTEAEVINVGDEMHISTPTGNVMLASFSIEAVEHRLVHVNEKEGEITNEYELRVRSRGKEIRLTVAPKDINNIVDIIQKKLPMSTVGSGIKKGNVIIVNFLRRQLHALPERHYVRISGFMKIAGRWVFAHDGAEFPGGNVVFQTGRTIPVDPALTPRGAFRNAMELMGISEKLELMLPLILVAHLSPLFRLFEAAGYVPRFVVFLNGQTGSLKTSTALVVFRLFREQPDSPEANFKDTETALEIKLGEANGKVILLDDYRPPVTSVDGKGNLTKLESVVRAAGDRIGKSRSNAELGKAKEFLPSGCVVVTGEDLGGTQSSQLRMLILSIVKGDIDGKKLKHFQDNPLLFMTHMYYFLKWVGEKGDSIIDFIKSEFERERAFFSDGLREARVIDTAATLMLTARILYAYGTAINAVDASGGEQLLCTWRMALLQAAIASESISKVQNPVCLYLTALFDLLDQRVICVAGDIKSYEADKHIGYAVEDSLWLWHRQVYAHVCAYWKRLGVLFPLTCAKVSEHLESAGLIRVSYETHGAGKKKLYGIKSGLPGRKRLMVLNEPLARQYLENESE